MFSFRHVILICLFFDVNQTQLSMKMSSTLIFTNHTSSILFVFRVCSSVVTKLAIIGKNLDRVNKIFRILSTSHELSFFYSFRQIVLKRRDVKNGFRAMHSTMTAHSNMQKDWVNNSEQGQKTGILIWDLSAAFDTLDTNLLCEKLNLHGFTENTIKWFRAFLQEIEKVVIKIIF